jgi:sugar (pentulose or hexulose) kinase
MNNFRFIAVIDIGKTNVKLALVDLVSCTEIEILKRPNLVQNSGIFPHYDVEGIWQFILQGLRQFKNFEAISITTHGATAALIAADGELALPILDYEHDVTLENYENLQPPFSQTGSPRLPLGLNLGAQLHWLKSTFPLEFAKTKNIVMYPQYWAFRLTGVVCNEVTSLGCHTDLWRPAAQDYSSLVDDMGWRKLMAPLAKASSIIGTTKPNLGLGDRPVAVGIHDSNASLMPHLQKHKKPFAVVSTGTWVVAMAVGSPVPNLDEMRDTLININAFGDTVPSARFIGGREFEIMSKGSAVEFSEADIQFVLQSGVFLLPSVVERSGPFPWRNMHWIGNTNPSQRFVALSFYLALMTKTCLHLIGAEGDIIVEGPFGENTIYCRMLAVATGRNVLASTSSKSGTTIGAALLLNAGAIEQPPMMVFLASEGEIWREYAKQWTQKVLTISA